MQPTKLLTMKDFNTNDAEVNRALKQALKTYHLNESYKYVEALMFKDIFHIANKLTPELKEELEVAADCVLPQLWELTYTMSIKNPEPKCALHERFNELTQWITDREHPEESLTVSQYYEYHILKSLVDSIDDLADLNNASTALAEVQLLINQSIQSFYIINL